MAQKTPSPGFFVFLKKVKSKENQANQQTADKA